MGEQKILFTAYNMKLQIIFLASTLAVTFSKNIPVPKLKQKTKEKVNALANSAANKAQALLAANGVSVDVNAKLNNAINAGKPQFNAVKKEADKKYTEFSSTYGNWNLGQLIDTLNNKVNSEINQAEAGAPDGAKTFIDIGQDVLKALSNAGKTALGNNQQLTIDQILGAAKKSAGQAINNQQVNQALKKANKKVNNIQVNN